MSLNPFQLSLSLSLALDLVDNSSCLYASIGFKHPSLLCFSLILLIFSSKNSFLVFYFLMFGYLKFKLLVLFYSPLNLIFLVMLFCYVALNASYKLMISKFITPISTILLNSRLVYSTACLIFSLKCVIDISCFIDPI